MLLIYYFCIGLGLFGLAVLSVKKFIAFAYKLNIIDIPNSRSSHFIPVARGGGLVISFFSELLIISLYFLGYLKFNIMCALSCAFFMSIIGFLDDLIKLSSKLRFVMQFVASLIAVALIVPLDFNSLISIGIFIVSVISLVWSINLFNFMDGTDGLAGCEAVCVLMIGSLLLYSTTNNTGFASCLFLISLIVAGFLCFNWPPAKVFMGDVGSYFLGFLIGISGLISHFCFEVSCVFWLILYSVFYFDATVTLLRRVISGQKWYVSHRSHAYQRLQNIGWQHKDILVGLIIINAALTLVALIAYYYKKLLPASGVILILLSIIYLLIELSERAHAKNI